MDQAVQAGEATPTPKPVETPSARDRQGSAFQQWYMIFALTAMMAVAMIDRSAISLVVDPMKHDLGLSDTEVSLLVGLSFILFHTIVTFPAGWIVDRMNRKWFIFIGGALWSAATFCTGLAGNFWQVFVGRSSVGFAEGGIGPAAFSMIRDGMPRHRQGRAYGFFMTGAFLGGALALFIASGVLAAAAAHGPLVVPLLGEVRPWQLVFFVVGLGGLPFILLLIPVREPGRAAAVADAATEGGGYGEALRFMIRNWRLYLPLMLFSGLFSMTTGAYAMWGPALANRTFEVPLPQVGVIMGLILLLVTPVGLFTFGSIIDGLTRRGVKASAAIVACWGAGLACAPAILSPLAPSAAMFWALYGFMMFVGSAILPAMNVLKLRITPSRASGKIYAIYNLQTALVTAAGGPLIVGLVSDNVFGEAGAKGLGYAISLTAATFFGFLTFAGWWLLKEMRRFDPPDDDAGAGEAAATPPKARPARAARRPRGLAPGAVPRPRAT